MFIQFFYFLMFPIFYSHSQTLQKFLSVFKLFNFYGLSNFEFLHVIITNMKIHKKITICVFYPFNSDSYTTISKTIFLTNFCKDGIASKQLNYFHAKNLLIVYYLRSISYHFHLSFIQIFNMFFRNKNSSPYSHLLP